MTHIILKAKKILTASDKYGCITDGYIEISDDKIIELGSSKDKDMTGIEVIDYGDNVITPGLIDCHCHLSEYAPASMHPVTPNTVYESESALMLHTLECGITTVGDHICGFPGYFMDYRKNLEVAKNATLRDVPALCTITLGGEPMGNFNAIDGNVATGYERLLDPEILDVIIEKSEFPGENVFLTATPANAPLSVMPNAGKKVYTDVDLKQIADRFHKANKRIGAHVGGADAIDQAIRCGIDVLHHGHEITDEQIAICKEKGIDIVDTPLGGTHCAPRSPKELLHLVKCGIPVAVATDAYLPAPEGFEEVGLIPGKSYGPEALMAASALGMRLMLEDGFSENDCIKLITKNPAAILELGEQIGKLEPGYIADITITSGIPGLEVVNPEEVKAVYMSGKLVIAR